MYKYSIKSVLVSITIMTYILLGFIAGYINLNNAKNVIVRNQEKYISNEIIQIKSEIENDIIKIKNTLRFIARNEEIRKLIQIFDDDRLSVYLRLMAKQEIEFALQGFSENNDYIDAIILFSANMIYTSNQYNFIDLNPGDVIDEMNKYYKENLNDDVFYINMEDHADIDQVYKNVYSSSKIFRSKPTLCTMIQENGRVIGCICLILDDGLYEKMQKSYIEIAVTDRNDHLIWASSQGEKLYDHIDRSSNIKENYRIYDAQTVAAEWEIYFFYNLGSINQQLVRILKLMFLSFAVSLVLLTFLTKTLLKFTIKPLTQLIQNISGFKNGSNNSLNFIFRGRLTLRERITYHLMISVILPLIIYITAITPFTFDTINKSMKDTISRSFTMIAENIDRYIKEEENIFEVIVLNQELIRFLEVYSSPENKEKYDIISNMITNNMLLYHYIDYELLDIDRNIILRNIWFYNDEASKDFRTYLPVKLEKWDYLSKDAFSNWYVGKYASITSNIGQSEYRNLGYLKAYIRETSLEQLYKNIEKLSEDICIVNGQDIIISSPQKELIGSHLDVKNDKKSVLMQIDLKNEKWKLIGRFDNSEIEREGITVLYKYIYIIIAILFLIIFLSNYIAIILVRHFGRVGANIDKVGTGSNEGILVEASNISEIEELYKSFNDMSRRIDDLIDQVLTENIAKRKLEEEKRNLEQTVLQEQIKPHFLYNTLESIRCMFYGNETEKAGKMLSALGNLFKYGIGIKEPMVSIEEEIRYTKSFVDIMSMKYLDCISFEWNIEKDLMQYSTLKLVLQPLIENAINHGLEKGKYKKGGVIKIGCRHDEEKITLTVEDNGKGLNTEELVNVREKILHDTLAGRNVGLYNINRRLKLYYGEQYGIVMDSQFGQGTCVSIIFPKILSKTS